MSIKETFEYKIGTCIEQVAVIKFLLDKINIENKMFCCWIYEYNSESDAVKTIVDYYIELRGGKESPTTQFYEVPEGLSFQAFNAFINNQ